MLAATIRVILGLAFSSIATLHFAHAGPSRIDCLAKLYNPTKAELDACVKGEIPLNSSTNQVTTINTNAEEATCSSFGFKRKTEGFASCVLELVDRRSSNAPVNPNDPDDITCRRYGFKPKTNEYASCRQQIDQARTQAQQQQAQYQQQLDAYNKQKSQAAGIAMMGMGLGMLSNNSSGSSGYGAPPSPPQMSPRTYMLPGNKIMTCTTTGNITSCN